MINFSTGKKSEIDKEFKKKNGFWKGLFIQLRNEKNSFDYWKTIIFLMIAVVTLVGGIYLWFK